MSGEAVVASAGSIVFSILNLNIFLHLGTRIVKPEVNVRVSVDVICEKQLGSKCLIASLSPAVASSRAEPFFMWNTGLARDNRGTAR